MHPNPKRLALSSPLVVLGTRSVWANYWDASKEASPAYHVDHGDSSHSATAHWTCLYGDVYWRVIGPSAAIPTPSAVLAGEAAVVNIPLQTLDQATVAQAQQHDLSAQLRVFRAVRLALARWF